MLHFAQFQYNSRSRKGCLHSTNLISLPVRPPIRPSAALADAAALDTEEPAELDTRVRPSEAFETPV